MNAKKTAAHPGPRKRLGNAGERLARIRLEREGFTILCANYRCPIGEIDLVAEEDGELVFVEVKTRRGHLLGTPEEAITPRKQEKLIAVASTYLQEHQSEERGWRIDAICIELGPGGKVERIEHIRHAVTSG